MELRNRSKLEVKVGEWLDRIGLVRWVPNYQVLLADATKLEVDFAWPKLRVCLEVSPSYTHGAQDTQDRDSDRRRLLLLDGWRLVEAGDRHLESFETMDPIFDALRHLIDQTGPGDVH